MKASACMRGWVCLPCFADAPAQPNGGAVGKLREAYEAKSGPAAAAKPGAAAKSGAVANLQPVAAAEPVSAAPLPQLDVAKSGSLPEPAASVDAAKQVGPRVACTAEWSFVGLISVYHTLHL